MAQHPHSYALVARKLLNYFNFQRDGAIFFAHSAYRPYAAWIGSPLCDFSINSRAAAAAAATVTASEKDIQNT